MSWFSRKTVAEVLADFSKTVEELQYIADQAFEDARQHRLKIDELKTKVGEAMEEESRAIRVRDKLMAIIE